MKTRLLIILMIAAHNVSGQPVEKEMLRNLPYVKYSLKIPSDTITFYLSETNSTERLPLVVFIQGSGNNSLFIRNSDGRVRPTSGHITWYDQSKGRYRLMIVEKPGLRYLQTGESEAFDKKFSLQSWVSAIVSAIEYVRQNEKIQLEKILVAGHSEGGLVASAVSSKLEGKVSHVACLAGEGPSQLYSLYKLAESGEFFNSPEHNMPEATQRLDYLERQWKLITADPMSTSKKFWGFTYLRWSSMLSTSVIDELTRFSGKMLLVQGTDDRNVYPESAVIAYTSLLSKGKKIRLEWIRNADHSFNIKDHPEQNGWASTIDIVIEWFLK